MILSTVNIVVYWKWVIFWKWVILLSGASDKEPTCQSRRHEPQVQSLGWKDPLEEEMATHSSILAWRISWTGYSGGLWSIASQRVSHDWSDLAQFENNRLNIFKNPTSLEFDSTTLEWATKMHISYFGVHENTLNLGTEMYCPQACKLQLLSPCELEPMLCHTRSRFSEKPVHCN